MKSYVIETTLQLRTKSDSAIRLVKYTTVPSKEKRFAVEFKTLYENSPRQQASAKWREAATGKTLEGVQKKFDNLAKGYK